MAKTWLQLLALIALLGCGGGRATDTPPKSYLSDEYFRKQRDCESRTPPDRSRLGNVDYGAPVHDPRRAAVWRQQTVYLGATCFTANIGPYYYIGGNDNEPTSYSIDVETRVSDALAPGGSSSLVLFSRNFKMAELPAGFEKVEIAEIVSFSDANRTANFNVGGNTYAYIIPAR